MLYVPNFKNEYPTCPFLYIDFNAPNIQNKSAFIEFIEKKVNAQLPDHLKDPELFDFVYAHSRTCYKYKVKSYVDNGNPGKVMPKIKPKAILRSR